MLHIVGVTGYFDFGFDEIQNSTLVVKGTLSFFEIVIKIGFSVFSSHGLGDSETGTCYSPLRERELVLRDLFSEITLLDFKIHLERSNGFACKFTKKLLSLLAFLIGDFESNNLLFVAIQLLH